MDAQDFRSLQEAYMEVVENQQQLDELSDKKVQKTLKARERRFNRSVDSGAPNKEFYQLRRTEKLVANRNRRTGSNIPVDEDLDLYDIILSHLLDEGYAETVESAEAIMVNMSEEWREGILDEAADNVIMTVKSPSGQERSKIRKGAWGPSDSHRHEKPEQIANRRFSQQLADRKKEREERMRAGRLTVATKRGIVAATNRSNDGVGGNRFVQGSSLRARERDDVPTDYRARRRRASGR